MSGTSHLRQVLIGPAIAVAVVAFASGCTIGTTELGSGDSALSCPLGADVGPGRISVSSASSFGLFIAAPTTAAIQFEATGSDSTQPVTASVFSFGSSQQGSFGVVWDGSQSAGIKSIPWHAEPSVPFIPSARGPAGSHLSWWITALDANGNEVGFSDCRQFVIGAPW